MKLKYNFVIRNIDGTPVAVTVGDDHIKFNGMIKLNESGEIIMRKLINGAAAVDDIADCLLEEYDIDKDTAIKSVSDFVEVLRKDGIIDG